MYFGCHFLHQCIAGIIIGIYISKKVTTDEMMNRILNIKKKKAILIVFIMAILVVIFYWIQKLFGVDPQWSIRIVGFQLLYMYATRIILYIFFQAFKWCEDPTYLKPDTTPVYGLIRSVGLAFGLAVSAPLKIR